MVKNIIKSIRAGVCYNQEELAQFSFLASILHKALKNGLIAGFDVSRLKEIRVSLADYLNRNFERISIQNFLLLNRYYEVYKEKGLSPPRICIKGHYQEKIVDLFRSDGILQKNGDPIESNTGFKDVYDTGKYYLCNNIPDFAKSHKYVNPRLNNERVSLYNNSQIDSFFKFVVNIGDLKSVKFDVEWGKCWYDYNQDDKSDSRNRSFYKSTLIIPMTLMNSSVQQPFVDLFKPSDADADSGMQRMIFGYLCFDHTLIDFFDENDIDIGYIYADLLSLYIINNLMYTSYSNTYKKVLQMEGVV